MSMLSTNEIKSSDTWCHTCDVSCAEEGGMLHDNTKQKKQRKKTRRKRRMRKNVLGYFIIWAV